MADLDECSWNMVELDYLSILSLDVQLYMLHQIFLLSQYMIASLASKVYGYHFWLSKSE